MAKDDDDFDKIEDDFASEFDMDDENDNSGKMSAPPEQPPSKTNFNTILRIIIVVTVVVSGSYYGYQEFFAGKSKEKTNEPTANAMPDKSAQGKPVTDALPEIASKPVAKPEEINFDETFAQTQTESIDNALKQTKTFEQVQKELKAAAPQVNKPQQVPEEVNAALDSLSEEMTANANQLKNVENNIQALTQVLEQLNQSITAMDNRILSLTENVDGLTQDLNQVKKIIVDEDLDLTQTSSIKSSSKKTTPSLSSKTGSYAVHAIIPGRAWLRTGSGQIITVTEGDKVGDFGTIAVIDANNGLVRTSSGITFR